MRTIRYVILFFFVSVFGFLIIPKTVFAVDNWAKLLRDHVVQGKVDYQGMLRDSSLLDEYLITLEKTDLKAISNQEKLALFINGYNACTVRLILDHSTKGAVVGSIKDIGSWFSSPWDIRFCSIGGTKYTLNEIEHDVIRAQFTEPRVHFALNCASKSCPPLASVPYQGATLDAQLEKQAIDFVNNPRSNFVQDSTLHLSKIFDWYKKDFPGGVYNFVKKYASGALLQQLSTSPDTLPIRYNEYDWSLNNN